MPEIPKRKFLRADHAIDQRTFDTAGDEVGIDNQTHDGVWSDALVTGRRFRRNIADAALGTSLQPRRGEILVTRLESTQETRAIPYRARRHERPEQELTHGQAAASIPQEGERRSVKTARHDRHTRASWQLPEEHKDRGTKLRQLAFGGNLPKQNARLRHREAALERLDRMEASQRQQQKQAPADDVPWSTPADPPASGPYVWE